jgi:hypothetical protein
VPDEGPSTVVPPAGVLAAQRRALAHRPHVAATGTVRRLAPPEVPTQVARVYDTPDWVPAARPGSDVAPLALVDDEPTGVPRPEGMIRAGRWTSPRGANIALGLLVIGFLALAGSSASGLLAEQSTPALALTLASLLGASGLYAVLVVLRPVVVELSEPWLVVRHRDRVDTFNLASPFQEIRLEGEPGTWRWRLELGCPDGRVVRLGRRMVDSRAMDVVIGHSQVLAQLERTARMERFDR